MPSILLSGPAGGGKSQEAKRLRDSNPSPAVLADFQRIYVALTGDERGPDGKYPLRDENLLPITEYVRRSVIGAATERGLDVILTNSDGDPDRRQFLLSLLPPGSTERIIDPGREIVTARLSDAVTNELPTECDAAIGRWYGRLA